ncbi:AAA family ATPase [Paludisphaera sp.]|uniref:AAA family ATPase n=1 Tax=Paludisphaera sp. TaxID=2017432 RepID=UPI00301C0082
MRIRTLRVGAYGRHKDLELAFDGDGVQMILGPNEAGKTTLLEFVRELLFGFAERSKYAFGPAANGKIEGSASLVLDDGAAVELHRRKGRKRTVTGTVAGREEPLDEESFEALLGGASEGLYRSVFAFGLEELAAGEKALSEQSVKAVLFSVGAAGPADPKKVLDSLDSEARKIYTDGARVLPVNKLLTELTELSRRIKEKSIRCESYEQRRRELLEAEAEAAALGSRLVEAARELARRERLAKALAPWRELAALRGERAGLSAPEGFPADGLERFNALEKETADQIRERDKNREDAETAARDLEALRFDPRPIERRAAIESLARSITAVQQARRDLPEHRRARDAALRDASDRLAELVPGWTLDDLRRFRLTAEARERLDRLVADRDSRARSLDALARDRSRDAEELADKQAALQALGEPEDPAPWAALLAGVDDYNDDEREYRRLRKEHRDLQRQAADLLPRLAPPLLDPTLDAARLPAPPREAVARFGQEIDRIDRRIDDAESALAKDEAEAAALDGEVAALADRDGEIPSRDILQDMRQGRDAGWALIRRKFIDHEDAEAEVRDWLAEHTADADLVDAFPRSVARADEYADELFRHSSAVAKQERLHALRDRVRRGRQALDDLKADRESLDSRWRALWSPCGFAPLDPDAMSAWLDRLEDLRSLQARLAETEQEGRCVSERIKAFEARLAAMVGRDAAADELIAAARRREQAARDAEKSRAQLAEDCRKLRDRIERNGREDEARRAESADADARLVALLGELRLPESWSLELLGRVLRGMEGAAKDLKAADHRGERIAADEATLAAFDPVVAALAAEIAPDLDGLEPERLADELQARLTASVADRERQAALERGRAHALAEASRREERLTRLAAGREELFRLAGVETAEAFRAVAERAAAVARLDRDIEAKGREFDLIRDADPRDAFIATLEASDAVSLEADRAEAEAARDRLQGEKSAADQEVGSRRQALSEYERGGGDAAEILETAASRRSQLAEFVDRYVPLVFAQHLLRRAIARFEQDARPMMLRETSRLFAMMTDGRYVHVDRPEDDEGRLQVRRVDGEILEPDQLSVGTREQLYLAVRLAYALHYCDRAESLPIVMDDVLANFDDDRSRRTLRALGEVSGKAQVIFLTCHPHVVELGREVFPALRPITLAANPEAVAPPPAPKAGKGRRQPTLLGLSPSD